MPRKYLNISILNFLHAWFFKYLKYFQCPKILKNYCQKLPQNVPQILKTKKDIFVNEFLSLTYVHYISKITIKMMLKKCQILIVIYIVFHSPWWNFKEKGFGILILCYGCNYNEMAVSSVHPVPSWIIKRKYICLCLASMNPGDTQNGRNITLHHTANPREHFLSAKAPGVFIRKSVDSHLKP